MNLRIAPRRSRNGLSWCANAHKLQINRDLTGALALGDHERSTVPTSARRSLSCCLIHSNGRGDFICTGTARTHLPIARRIPGRLNHGAPDLRYATFEPERDQFLAPRISDVANARRQLMGVVCSPWGGCAPMRALRPPSESL